MANLIQIKRSTTATTPGSLANGELAFTSNGDVLYIGSPNGSVIGIGGLRVPGVLTANQALVANTSGFLDEIRTANAVITKLYANGSHGSAGQTLTSNSTGGVYWSTPTPSVVGNNTEIQFNDSGALGSNPNFTFDKTTGSVSANNFYATLTVNAAALTAGAGLTANSSGLYTTGTVNAATLSVDGNFVANSTGVYSTGAVNGAVLSVGTSFLANTTRVVIGNTTGLVANNTIGNPGDSLLSNGSSVYWDTRVSSVATGDGLSGGPITSTGTIAVIANSGIIANSTGVFVRPGTGVTVNATGVHIGQAVETTSNVTFNRINATGNVVFGDSIGDIISLNGSVNTNIMPAANVTQSLGNNTIRWAEVYAGNLHANAAYFDGSVQITGNLSVLGTSTTVSTNNLVVDDSLIQLASNNTTSDLLDIGFFGSYNPDNGPHEHTGLFRDATVDMYRLFKGLQQSPTNVVNTNGVGYTIATLEAYLSSGGLISNGTNLAITANSTVNVAIVANTLTLSTALTGTSGGTGKSTVTNNAILVGNTTNGYNELALGVAGYVLQSNGTALVYDILDGGTF